MACLVRRDGSLILGNYTCQGPAPRVQARCCMPVPDGAHTLGMLLIRSLAADYDWYGGTLLMNNTCHEQLCSCRPQLAVLHTKLSSHL